MICAIQGRVFQWQAITLAAALCIHVLVNHGLLFIFESEGC